MFRETFTFKELDNRVGLFVIEFIGNGHSSRAVIRKGNLSIIHQPTIAGHVVFILDDKKTVRKKRESCALIRTCRFAQDQRPDSGSTESTTSLRLTRTGAS